MAILCDLLQALHLLARQGESDNPGAAQELFLRQEQIKKGHTL